MVVVVTVEWWCWGMWWTRQRCWCGDGDRSGGDGASGGG